MWSNLSRKIVWKKAVWLSMVPIVAEGRKNCVTMEVKRRWPINKYIITHAKTLHIYIPVNVSYKQCVKKLKDAWQKLKRIQKSANDHRAQFLEERAAFYAALKNRPMEKILQSILHSEKV